MKNNNEILEVSDSESDKSEKFINNKNFQALRELQERIYRATEVTPSIRKLVNDLISEENLKKLEATIVQAFK